MKSRVYADQAADFFKQADANASGSLTRKELVNRMSMSIDLGMRYERLFWRLDHDADESISKDEFLNAVARWMK